MTRLKLHHLLGGQKRDSLLFSITGMEVWYFGQIIKITDLSETNYYSTQSGSLCAPLAKLH